MTVSFVGYVFVPRAGLAMSSMFRASDRINFYPAAPIRHDQGEDTEEKESGGSDRLLAGRGERSHAASRPQFEIGRG